MSSHQIGDVRTRYQQHERNQYTKSGERLTILFLHIGDSRGRGLQQKRFIEKSIDEQFGSTRETFGLLRTKGSKDRLQSIANRLDCKPRLHPDKGSKPTCFSAVDCAG